MEGPVFIAQGVDENLRQLEKASVVLIRALFRRGDAWQAFVVEGGHPRL